LRRLIEEVVDGVVVESASGKIQVADVEIELTSNSLSEGGLACSRRSVEQVTTSVGDTLVSVPLGLALEPLDIFA